MCSGGRGGDVIDMSVGGGAIWSVVKTWIWNSTRSPGCKVVVRGGKHRHIWLTGRVEGCLALFLHQWKKCGAWCYHSGGFQSHAGA